MLNRTDSEWGPPEATSTFADRRLVIAHALNRLDPHNYQTVQAPTKDGGTMPAWQYCSPPDEARHLAALQASGPNQADMQLVSHLSLAINDPQQSSAELAVEAHRWAQGQETAVACSETQGTWFHQHPRLVAAFIVLRDGEEPFRRQCREWCWEAIEASAASMDRVSGYQLPDSLRGNEAAVLFAAVAYSLRDHFDKGGVRLLLQLAGIEGANAAPGFAAAITVLQGIDTRLPRSVVRHAFVACIRPRRSADSEADTLPNAGIQAAYQQRLQAEIERELAWLRTRVPEPRWPAFPALAARVRRGIRMPPSDLDETSAEISLLTPPSQFVDTQSAARWTTACRAHPHRRRRSRTA